MKRFVLPNKIDDTRKNHITISMVTSEGDIETIIICLLVDKLYHLNDIIHVEKRQNDQLVWSSWHVSKYKNQEVDYVYQALYLADYDGGNCFRNQYKNLKSLVEHIKMSKEVSYD